MAFSGPLYLNVRDRLADLATMVSWFERAGHERIVLLDNDSSWPPLLEYLEQSPHEVVRLGKNYGCRSLWDAGMVPDEWFAYSDPDILPLDDCPLDLLDRLQFLSEKYGKKAGPALYLADLPKDFWQKGWEQLIVSDARWLGDGWDSLIDTTLAVYPPSFRQFNFGGIRAAPPYIARHMGWYSTMDDPEFAYYVTHAIRGPSGTSWSGDKQPKG